MRPQSTPYFHARTGRLARDDIIRRLSAVGCVEIEFIDDEDNHVLLLHFRRGDRRYTLHASAKGWASAHLTRWPHVSRIKLTEAEYQDRVLQQGHIAASGILRDFIRCQLAIVETGVLTYDEIWPCTWSGP